jgi:hypothetical protein
MSYVLFIISSKCVCCVVLATVVSNVMIGLAQHSLSNHEVLQESAKDNGCG